MSFAGNVFKIGNLIKFKRYTIISAIFNHRNKIINKQNSIDSLYCSTLVNIIIGRGKLHYYKAGNLYNNYFVAKIIFIKNIKII